MKIVRDRVGGTKVLGRSGCIRDTGPDESGDASPNITIGIGGGRSMDLAINTLNVEAR